MVCERLGRGQKRVYLHEIADDLNVPFERLAEIVPVIVCAFKMLAEVGIYELVSIQ